jgi:hypothetical protein
VTTQPQYQRRLLVFLDFLGFKEIVAETVGNEARLDALVGALDLVREIGDGMEKTSEQITQFSDCLVLSYAVTEPSAVFRLLYGTALTVVSIAERGFLLRGAVTIGELLHNTQLVIGPALVEAHRLESKVAKMPRVLIDPAVVTIARQYAKEHSPEEEAQYVKAFMSLDDDGQYYFDYVSWESVVNVTGGEDKLYPHYLERIGAIVERGLKHPDERVRKKYSWLRKKYVAAVDVVAGLPSGHPYRLQNPLNCRTIEGVSRCFERYERLYSTSRV